MKVTINTDGGFTAHRGAAVSYIIRLDGVASHLCSFSAPQYTTNNQAEYGALIHALSFLSKSHYVKSIDSIEHYCDSQLLVNHYNGADKVKESTLVDMMQQLKAYTSLVFNDKFTTTHIKRNLNTDADSLCDIILDTL